MDLFVFELFGFVAGNNWKNRKKITVYVVEVFDYISVSGKRLYTIQTVSSIFKRTYLFKTMTQVSSFILWNEMCLAVDESMVLGPSRG